MIRSGLMLALKPLMESSLILQAKRIHFSERSGLDSGQPGRLSS